jgi:hypothetical protein
MAGTTRLELATSAVTVHNLRMHLSAAESTELQRRTRVKSESCLSFVHYAAQKRTALHRVEGQGYDTKYVTENREWFSRFDIDISAWLAERFGYRDGNF